MAEFANLANFWSFFGNHPRRWFGARPRNFCWGSYALSQAKGRTGLVQLLNWNERTGADDHYFGLQANRVPRLPVCLELGIQPKIFQDEQIFHVFSRHEKNLARGGPQEKAKNLEQKSICSNNNFFSKFSKFPKSKKSRVSLSHFLIFWQRHVWMQKRPFGKNSSDLITPAHCFFAKYCTIFQAKNVLKKRSLSFISPGGGSELDRGIFAGDLTPGARLKAARASPSS